MGTSMLLNGTLGIGHALPIQGYLHSCDKVKRGRYSYDTSSIFWSHSVIGSLVEIGGGACASPED